jgi:hypothetical protein
MTREECRIRLQMLKATLDAPQAAARARRADR